MYAYSLTNITTKIYAAMGKSLWENYNKAQQCLHLMHLPQCKISQ